jgi:hypothetical protein
MSGRQAYQAMALIAGVPDKDKEAAVWKHLENDILTKAISMRVLPAGFPLPTSCMPAAMTLSIRWLPRPINRLG